MSKAKAPRVFVPLTKVDEEQRLVYGTITQEVVDQSGEVMDYETSKPNFEKWSNDIHEASGGLSKGNLRVMHGLTVAGKLTDLSFNDDDKSIEVCSKVVDDAEWNKVLEGCYTGFSVGGKYGKKWKDTVDGAQITKFTAIPNEVSLVDNPCVKSATFSLVKADGAEELVAFKNAEVEELTKGIKEVPLAQPEISNEEVATRATELAKADSDSGKSWIDFIEVAREELMKAAAGGEDDADEGAAEEESEDVSAEPNADADDADADDKSEKVTPAGVMQKWTTSDGQLFEKKADAVTHEEQLEKAEPTEADKLRARLEKAKADPEDEQTELPLVEDFDRMSKVVAALSTPFVGGEPKLEKGMHTVNRFSNVLSDMASVARCIKAEGKKEGDDASDASVSEELMGAVKTLGKSFVAYATNQVTELLAGLDDEVIVSYHDYYYNAVQVDPENGLAKDVCEAIHTFREEAGEMRETLAKAYGLVIGETLTVDDGELSPPLQKRFDDLQKTADDFKKIAEDAVASVEELNKRVQAVEDTPLPRAPKDGSIAFLNGDVNFLGKSFSNPGDLMNEVHNLIKTKGPDALALELIKASQNSGGQKLNLSR